MLLAEVFKLIDRLTPEQKQQIKQYIDHQPDILRDEFTRSWQPRGQRL